MARPKRVQVDNSKNSENAEKPPPKRNFSNLVENGTPPKESRKRKVARVLLIPKENENNNERNAFTKKVNTANEKSPVKVDNSKNSENAEQPLPKQDSSKLVENGGTQPKESRKRKIARVPPMPKENENNNVKDGAFFSKENTTEEESPVKAKKIRETLRKRTTREKKPAKRSRTVKTDKNEPKKPQFCLTVPKSPDALDGEVLSMGTGDTGQLGLGSDVTEKSRPAPVPGIPEAVVDIAAGGMHSVCLTVSGKIYTFGCNDDGTLGRLTEEEEDQFVPGLVELPEKVVRISAGDSHSAVLTEGGLVYAWGTFRDSSGDMGFVQSGKKEPLPVRIMLDVPCASLASGENHLVFLGLDGQLYTMGNAEQGQLGRISQYCTFRGGRRGPDSLLKPDLVHFRRMPNVKSFPPEFDEVWAGSFCTFARERHTKTIYGFGLNNYYQFGKIQAMLLNPTPLIILQGMEWKMFAFGNHHVIGLDGTGQVMAWGRKDDGRLGLGPNADHQSEPVPVPSLEDTKCKHVSCASSSSFAVSEDGTLYSWGFGETMLLGHGNEDDCDTPKAVESNAMKSRIVVKVEGGGQHTLLLCTKRESAAS